VLSSVKPTRTGYTFAGWNTAVDGSGTVYTGGAAAVCAALTLYAQWSQAFSPVAYEPNGGSGDPADQTCTGSSMVLSSTVPTRSGYTFMGWNTASDGSGVWHAAGAAAVCSALTLYAQWQNTSTGGSEVPTVAFEANGGTGDPADQSCTAGSTVVLSSTQPTRSGYTFTGWNTAADGSGVAHASGAAAVCASLTLYAQWANSSTSTIVAYEPNGGSGDPSDQSCTAGQTMVLSTVTPTRSGYAFTGWNTVADGSGTAYAAGAAAVCASLTLYAQWSGSSSTVAFEANGGTGDPADQSCTSGSVVLSSTVPVRDGYSFLGWNTTVDGSGVSYASGSSIGCSTVTLYAQWAKNTVTLQYLPNGGSAGPASTVGAPAETMTVSTQTPSRPGYSFAGWNTQCDGQGAAYAGSSDYVMPSAGTVTLCAQWIPVLSATPAAPGNFPGGGLANTGATTRAALQLVAYSLAVAFFCFGAALLIRRRDEEQVLAI